jgi:hypothetical protein
MWCNLNAVRVFDGVYATMNEVKITRAWCINFCRLAKIMGDYHDLSANLKWLFGGNRKLGRFNNELVNILIQTQARRDVTMAS